MRYYSYSGDMTIKEATDLLGPEACDALCSMSIEEWQREVVSNVRSAWSELRNPEHKAWCTLMQCGQGALANELQHIGGHKDDKA